MAHRSLRLLPAALLLAGMIMDPFAHSLFAQAQKSHLLNGAAVEEPVLLLTLKDRWEEAWLGSPAVSDIDCDGVMEIIVPRGNALVVWKADGALFWKFNDTPGRIFAGPVVADFRGDSCEEIAFTSGDQVFMLDAEGNLLSGFPVTWEGELRSLAGGDIDGDGELDLVTSPARVLPVDVVNAWHADGSLVDGFPPNSAGSSGCDEDCYPAGSYDQNIAVGDLDGDLKMDIVVPHDNTHASFYKGSGEAFDANAMFQSCTKTPGVPYLHDLALAQQGWSGNHEVDLQSEFTAAAPAIADVDDNGFNEIILLGNVQNVSKTDLRKGVALWVVRPDASRLPGWETPFHVSEYLAGRDLLGGNLPGATNQVAIADINSVKPGPEFIFAGFDGRIHAVASDKSELWSFIYTTDTTVLTGGVVIGDLSGDGLPEVVFNTYSTESDQGALFVLDEGGDLLHRIALPRRGALPVPTLSDIDNNGTAEIVVSLKDAVDNVESVLVYTVPLSSADRLIWPTGRGNYLRNGWWIEPDSGPNSVATVNGKALQNRLDQNCPNPFYSSTQIAFYLTDHAEVHIEVYNTLGKKVETLLEKTLQAGHHELVFNARDLSGGIYFYKIRAGVFQEIKKMILLK